MNDAESLLHKRDYPLDDTIGNNSNAEVDAKLQ